MGLTIILATTLVDDAFESLFFGTGAIFGLLIFMALCVGLAIKWKYMGFLLVPLIILFEAEYISRLDVEGNYIWHITVLLFLALFISLKTILDIKNRR